MLAIWEYVVPLAFLVLLALLLLCFVMLARLRRENGGEKNELLRTFYDQQQAMSKLQGRIQQLLSEQGQSRHQMEQRLDGVSNRLGEQSNHSQTTLATMREALARLETEQQKMVSMGDGLREDVGSLKNILSNRQARGAYGEIRLYDMVKSVLPTSMVEQQKTLSNGKKVDCLIRLPLPTGSIPVDAKFPLENFQRIGKAESKEARLQVLKEFGKDIKGHVDDIADKYLLPGETADIALMFVPSEAVYGDIHANLEEVVDYAWKRRVFIVSPTTMMAVLASVRAIMRHATSHEQALKVQQRVALLKKDMKLLGERVEKLDRHFHQVTDDVEKLIISKDKINRHTDNIDAIELAVLESSPTTSSDDQTLLDQSR